MNKKNKRIILFFHVEKSGGTSLLASSRRRFQLRHCDIISSARCGNVATARDFEKTINLYPLANFIAGHCLCPNLIDQYREVAKSLSREITAMTLVRDPVKRLLSDYAHYSRRGGRLSLNEFIEIPFKINYYSNFFAGGAGGNAERNLSKMEYVVKVEHYPILLNHLDKKFGMELKAPAKTNLNYSKDLPKDLCFQGAGSEKFSRYMIDPKTLQRIYELNKDDVKLIDKMNFWRPDQEKCDQSLEELSVLRTKPLLGLIYRNLCYKIAMQRRVGVTLEGRNKIPVDINLTKETMWL